jgi:hypothetical protein
LRRILASVVVLVALGAAIIGALLGREDSGLALTIAPLGRTPPASGTR